MVHWMKQMSLGEVRQESDLEVTGVKCLVEVMLILPFPSPLFVVVAYLKS